MSYTKIWIHAVWGTKRRTPFLNKEIHSAVIDHIKENAKEKKIYIDSINGFDDHLHCLISLDTEQSISKVMQLIKGESAFWINKQKLTKTKFEWADEYYAASVSPYSINKVRAYIQNQEEHHKKVTFRMDYEEFIKQYSFDVEG